MNRDKRKYSTVLVERDEPINLRVFCEVIAKKIVKGEIKL